MSDKSKELINEVASGKSTASTVVKDSLGIKEFMDERDVTEAVMLVIRNDGNLYRALMSGKMSPAQATTKGINEYEKHLFREIRDDIRAARKDIEGEVKSWIATVKRGG